MGQVTIRINGYNYVVGCADGQEPHLIEMAGVVDQEVERVKALGAPSGEAKLLALAAVLLADRLHDATAELSALRAAPARGKGKAQAASLTRLAEKAEAIAAALEAEPPDAVTPSG